MPSLPTYRVGLIVPSSNVAMETEVPALLRAYEHVTGVSFTFHGARTRMKKLTAEALLAMDREDATCAAYLGDAPCDVQAYACLVAVMVQGRWAHGAVAERLHAAAAESGRPAPVVTSAGALDPPRAAARPVDPRVRQLRRAAGVAGARVSVAVR